MRKLYTCTDREGVIYRRWVCTEDEARRYAHRYVANWTLLVDSSGLVIESR